MFCSGTYTCTHMSAFSPLNIISETVNLNKVKRFILTHIFGGPKSKIRWICCSGLWLGCWICWWGTHGKAKLLIQVKEQNGIVGEAGT